MLLSAVPQGAHSVRKAGVGEREWILWPKMFGKCYFFYVLLYYQTVPYQELQHVNGFEKSFSK